MSRPSGSLARCSKPKASHRSRRRDIDSGAVGARLRRAGEHGRADGHAHRRCRSRGRVLRRGRYARSPAAGRDRGEERCRRRRGCGHDLRERAGREGEPRRRARHRGRTRAARHDGHRPLDRRARRRAGSRGTACGRWRTVCRRAGVGRRGRRAGRHDLVDVRRARRGARGSSVDPRRVRGQRLPRRARERARARR